MELREAPAPHPPVENASHSHLSCVPDRQVLLYAGGALMIPIRISTDSGEGCKGERVPPVSRPDAQRYHLCPVSVTQMRMILFYTWLRRYANDSH